MTGMWNWQHEMSATNEPENLNLRKNVQPKHNNFNN